MVLGDRIVCQAIKHIRDKQHELLNITSINDGSLLLSLFIERAEGLEERHNGLMCRPHECVMLGIQTVA
jgi:hypothetical protein